MTAASHTSLGMRVLLYQATVTYARDSGPSPGPQQLVLDSRKLNSGVAEHCQVGRAGGHPEQASLELHQIILYWSQIQ